MKFFTLFTAFFLLLLTSTANAQGTPNLKMIMIDLEADMEAIVRALNYDDFEAVKTHALEIANHQKPPMAQRKKIMAFLGSEMNGFKSSDAFVHDSAVKVAEAADEQNYAKVVESYGILLGGCVACHTKYRSRVLKHLEE